MECHDENTNYKSRKSCFTCRNCRDFSKIIEAKSKIPAKRKIDEESTSKEQSPNIESQNEGFQGFQLDELNDQRNDNTKVTPIEATSSAVRQSSNTDKPVEYESSIDFDLSANNHIQSFLQDEPVEDPSSWDCDNVYEYFSRYFPRDAHILRDEEIDGKSLLLMKRSDVIGLKLKLGVAINMYAHVLKLQTKKNDFTIAWS